ncbi:MAG: hypothetical protein C0627_12125 [Sulfurimonas sp.]|mgnify:CR=1 FL=1|nr:MAG: hypothetical protein C0627_12125 [Sulfurimonas sp.]
MNRKKIIATVKSQEEEKVPFSLKLPASLKEDIQSLAEKESVSMNSLIVVTLQSLINDDCGNELNKTKSFLVDYRDYLYHQLTGFYPTDPDEAIMKDTMKSKINALNSLLEDDK